ncbi:MAG TPA: hypothetical protein PKK78_04975 [Kouleothrix sp.]|jgi:hypothetical protein|nr:hypothetical protein [Kouleothrix sp.]
MVRIPAVLVAVVGGLVLDVATFGLALYTNLVAVPIVLLPLWAACAGCVATRWAVRTPPAPGLAAGVLLVACQVGAALGPYQVIQPYLDLRVLLLQLIAALSGGLIGMVLVRRSAGVARPAPTFTPLS